MAKICILSQKNVNRDHFAGTIFEVILTGLCSSV